MAETLPRVVTRLWFRGFAPSGAAARDGPAQVSLSRCSGQSPASVACRVR